MGKNNDYATELTKEDLQRFGVVNVDLENLIVYGAHGPFACSINNNSGYYTIHFTYRDKNGEAIKIPYKRKVKREDGTVYEKDAFYYKQIPITLSRVLWAWDKGIAHAGMVIDHQNNHHDKLEDYKIGNLQEIWPWQNVVKDADYKNKRELPTKKPLSYWEEKLVKYTAEYQEAKAIKDAIWAHRARSNVANTRAHIRYLVNNKGNKDGE